MASQPQACADCPPGPSKSTKSASVSAKFDQPIPIPAEGTFSPPSPESLSPSITIEFCDRCRWAPRATWTQTELFLTFPVPIIRSITLQPLTSPETGGRFRVWVFINDTTHSVWDRKTEGGFPELKVLKQRVRNILQPDLSLGHSDVHSTKSTSSHHQSSSNAISGLHEETDAVAPAARVTNVTSIPSAIANDISMSSSDTATASPAAGTNNAASEKAMMIFQKMREQNAALLAQQGNDKEVKKMLEDALGRKETSEEIFKIMGLRAV